MGVCRYSAWSTMTDGQSSAPLNSQKVDTSEARARLIRLQLDVLACPTSEVRRVLLKEIELARDRLAGGDSSYARHLQEQTAPLLRNLKRPRRFGFETRESAVMVVLL